MRRFALAAGLQDELSLLLADALAQIAAPAAPGGAGWQLPQLVTSGQLEPRLMPAVAKGYLLAELETAGLIACADAVAEARAQLRSSYQLASRVEQYVDLQRRSPSSHEREAFFIRWFGLGRHAAMDDQGNHAFFPRLAEFCGSLAALATTGIGAPARSFAEERARGALDRLIGELSIHAGGDLTIVPRIENIAALGSTILSDTELAALMGVNGLAAVVRTLVGGIAVDLAVAYQRGRAGQEILLDCGRLMPRTRGGGRFIEPSDPAIRHAVQWLASYGVGGGGRA